VTCINFQDVLRKKLFSTSKSNSALEFQFQIDNQPKNEYIHEFTYEPTPRLQFDGEGEENVDIEMQTKQSKYDGLLISLVSLNQ